MALKLMAGTLQTVGNSDVIENEAIAAPIAAGLAVKLGADNAVVLFDGSGIPLGFAMNSLGKSESLGSKRQSIVKSGLKFLAQVDASNVPAIGAQASIDVTGKITSAEGTDINAIVRSAALDAHTLDANGYISAATVKCVYLDFPNGI